MELIQRSVVDRVMTLRYCHDDEVVLTSSTTDRQWRKNEVATLDQSHSRQASFIADIHRFWWTRKFQELYRLIVSPDSPMQELFDPVATHCLLHFVALGGVDVICRCLSDRGVPYEAAPSLAIIYRALIRLATELIIVSPAYAWYLLDAHRDMYLHLLRLLCVRRLRESVLSLIEHTVSTVGPAVLMEKCPRFLELLDTAVGLEVGLASRVVALLIVPSMAPDKTDREPFPQCLARMRLIEDTIDSNVRCLLDHPTFLPKLLRLVDAKYFRRYTRGMEIEGAQESPFVVQNTPQGVAIQLPHGGDPQAQQLFMNQLQQALMGGGFAGGFGGLAAALGGGNPQMFEEDDADFDDFDEEEEEEDGGDGAAAGMHDDGGAAGAGAAPHVPDAHDLVEAVEAAAAEGHDLAGGGPPPSDVTDCGWFTGFGAPHDLIWRQRRVVLQEDTTPITSRLKKFAEANARPSSKTPKAIHMHIFNAQSEMLFVLNTLLCTAYHRRAWSMMCQHGLLGRLREVYPLLFSPKATQRDAVVPADTQDCDHSDSDETIPPDNHNHDQPTLRKIELQRVLHEYWDAHDVDECALGHRTDVDNDRLTIADMIAKHLATYEEDICVENLMCFSLEAVVRSHWLPDRRAVQLRFQWMLLPLLKRLFPSKLRGGSTTPLTRNVAYRRIESTFTAIAELCRYNPANWATVGKTLRAHKLEDSLIRAVLNNTFETNFFVRSLVLAAYPQLRSARAHRITIEELLAMRQQREEADPELLDRENSDANGTLSFESQQIILSRMYRVRVLSADLCRRRVTDADHIFTLLEDVPAACPKSQRRRWLMDNHSCVPSFSGPTSEALPEDRLEAAQDGSQAQEVSAIAELPSLWPKLVEVLPRVFRNFMGHLNCEDVETSEQVCVVTSSVAVAMAMFLRGGEGAVDELVRDAVAVHDAERADIYREHEAKAAEAAKGRSSPANCQKRQHHAASTRQGGDGVSKEGNDAASSDDDSDDVLDSEGHTGHGGGGHHGLFTSARGGDASAEEPHDPTLCASCRWPPTLTAKHKKRLIVINDLAANYYRIICAWLAHYIAQKDYFMTLFYCSEIDVPRWRAIAQVLLRVLPRHFKAAPEGDDGATVDPL